MDKIKKILNKVPKNIREKILLTIFLLEKGLTKNMDIKKIRNSKKLYRIRVGKYRIFFMKEGNNLIIDNISKRDENTYKL